jgi:hypothetical protein
MDAQPFPSTSLMLALLLGRVELLTVVLDLVLG